MEKLFEVMSLRYKIYLIIMTNNCEVEINKDDYEMMIKTDNEN